MKEITGELETFFSLNLIPQDASFHVRTSLMHGEEQCSSSCNADSRGI
jgi:hypothetical protein